MSNPLYQLTSAYRQVWQMVEDDDADLAVIEDNLACIEGAIEEKAANIAVFVNKLDTDADTIGEEIKRLQLRKRATDNRRDSIKAYLAQQMALAGMDKIKTATHTIALQNNPPAVNITDDALIPAAYVTVKTESVIDKKRIAEAIKGGASVPGAELVQGRSLRIR